MDKFNFIPLFFDVIFDNNGLRDYFVFIVACYGIQILYTLVAGWILKKWHY